MRKKELHMPCSVVCSGSIEMLGLYYYSASAKPLVIPWVAGLTRLTNKYKNIAFRTDLQTEIVVGGSRGRGTYVELEFGIATAIS